MDGEVILIVDDDPSNREMLRDAFEQLTGIRACTASNAVEAISVFRARQDIVAIVSDRQMGGPTLDGDALHLVLASEMRGRSVHFVLLHGSGDEGLEALHEAGVPVRKKSMIDIAVFVQEVVDAVRQLRQSA